MSPRLYVAFYRPLDGNYQHWALQLESNTRSILFEVTGEHPRFERNVWYDKPEKFKNFSRKLYVGTISESDVQMVKDAAKEVLVDNETVHWDSQDYVLDLLERLQEEYVLDEDDEDFIDAMTVLMKKRGPMI